VPLSLWLYEQDMTRMIGLLWLAIVSAGLAVLSAYGADTVKALYWGKREASEELEMRRAQE